MKELAEILFLTSVNTVAMTLGGIGTALTTASALGKIYFGRLCARHDDKYAKSSGNEPTTVEDLFNADKGFN